MGIERALPKYRGSFPSVVVQVALHKKIIPRFKRPNRVRHWVRHHCQLKFYIIYLVDKKCRKFDCFEFEQVAVGTRQLRAAIHPTSFSMARKQVKYFVVDAFTDSAFKGNPAAVCLLEEERDEEWLQAVASEFNLSETCYLTRLPDSADSSFPRFRLRWFTPVAEVKLCGHATLAASYTLFAHYLVNAEAIEFSTLSGVLTAKKLPDTTVSDLSSSQNGNSPDSFLIELDFPVVPVVEYHGPAEVSTISKSLNGAPVNEIHKTATSEDLFAVLPSGEAVEQLEPNIEVIQKCPGRGLIITGLGSPGSGFDFVSRFFCPKLGINEDPVCGSAHCALVDYWSKKLGKCDFVAYQASPRSGVLHLHLDEKNERVLLRGKAVAVMEGSLLI